ncbi:FkbM family methyltransferase [Geotalea uraniireducens]|uniref:Methyltransferase FkbM family n=1 Tax=Geotalea uraniireducens (strain Rf4) TaxID=351605 RepID=A5GEM7_GEOUR|nr:FkbM family methyltransferase [Geotalea uraniireducens]ABQ25882.1 methyltransferase FkbM family [Geotalea uraniireducens Rf4]
MSLFGTLKLIVNHPLNKERKIRSVIKWVKWQVGSRLVPGEVVYNWINGARVIVRPGETGFTGNIYCTLDEFSDMAYVLHVMTPEDFFVDIGANVGSYTILACAAKGARGYCFEPIPSTFQRLAANIRLNDLSCRVEAFNLGLSNKEGELVFTSSENCTNHVVTDGEKAMSVIKVKVVSLDTILSGLSPSMLKLDVEGFETLVLQGAHETLSNHSLHSVVMELNGSGSRYGFSEAQILNKMKDYGFSTYVYNPFIRELMTLDGKQNHSGNTLFIRNERDVSDKLHKSPRIQIGNLQL